VVSLQTRATGRFFIVTLFLSVIGTLAWWPQYLLIPINSWHIRLASLSVFVTFVPRAGLFELEPFEVKPGKVIFNKICNHNRRNLSALVYLRIIRFYGLG